MRHKKDKKKTGEKKFPPAVIFKTVLQRETALVNSRIMSTKIITRIKYALESKRIAGVKASYTACMILHENE